MSTGDFTEMIHQTSTISVSIHLLTGNTIEDVFESWGIEYWQSCNGGWGSRILSSTFDLVFIFVNILIKKTWKLWNLIFFLVETKSLWSHIRNGHQGLDMKTYILIKHQKSKQCPEMIKVHLFGSRICRSLRKPNSLIKWKIKRFLLQNIFFNQTRKITIK